MDIVRAFRSIDFAASFFFAVMAIVRAASSIDFAESSIFDADDAIVDADDAVAFAIARRFFAASISWCPPSDMIVAVAAVIIDDEDGVR